MISDKIYNLIITNGIDLENEYPQFLEKLFSKTNFLWKESISGSYKYAGEDFYKEIDCIILLAGLYKENKELFEDLIEASEKFNIPIVLVRPYGLENVPEKLESIATSIVGWNINCIIDSIQSAINECSYLCD